MSHSAIRWLWVPLALSTVIACSDDEEEPRGRGGAGGSAGNAGTGGGDGGLPAGLTCEQACARIVPASCPKGPPSAELCAALCNGILARNDQCASVFRAVLECVDESSTFNCAADGNPSAVGCEAEFEALVPCLPVIS